MDTHPVPILRNRLPETASVKSKIVDEEAEHVKKSLGSHSRVTMWIITLMFICVVHVCFEIGREIKRSAKVIRIPLDQSDPFNLLTFYFHGGCSAFIQNL